MITLPLLPAVQLMSSNCSPKLNSTKSGLNRKRRLHILAHRHTGKVPTFLNDYQRCSSFQKSLKKWLCLYAVQSRGVRSMIATPFTSLSYQCISTSLENELSSVLIYQGRCLTLRVLKESNLLSQLQIRIITQLLVESMRLFQNRKERMLSG